jgi:tetratricopeptide (TPR) repeat protein
MNLLLALTYQARILGEVDALSMGKASEAIPLLQRAVAIADEYVHADPADQSARGRFAMAGTTLGNIIRESDPKGALAIYDHVRQHMTEIKDNASFRKFEVTALAGSSYSLRRQGRNAEARQQLDAAFDRLGKLKLYPADKIKPGSEADQALSALAEYEAGRGNLSEAIATYSQLIDRVHAWKPAPETSLGDAIVVSRLYGSLAQLHRRARHVEQASDWEGRRRELWRRWDARLPHNEFVRRQLLPADGAGM